MKTQHARIYLIALLALTIASCDSSESQVTGVDTSKGTIRVGVASPGSSDFEIAVSLNGPAGFPPRTAPLRIGDTLTFDDLDPGTYTVGTTIFGFDCQTVSATVQGNLTTRVDIACTRKVVTATGVVIGIVTGGGSPLGGASVELSAPGFVLTRSTSVNGNLSFVGVPGGEYTLTAVHQHFNCPVQTIHIVPDQTTTVSLLCTPKATGTITGIVLAPFNLVDAVFQLTGPAIRTTTAGSIGNSFTFDELPPGRYTVTATASQVSCGTVSAEVQAARDTAVEIQCGLRSPSGSEVAGEWGFNRLRVSETGICPSTLPDTGTGSMAFRSSDSTIEIVGLDPQLAIVGRSDKDGVFAGSGSAVLADGSMIRSDVNLLFYWDVWDFGGLVFSTYDAPVGVWTRRHSDPSGKLVCAEVYSAFGWRVNW